MAGFCGEYPNCKAMLITRLCIIIFVNILSIIGNGTVLYIYRQINKQQPQSSKNNRYIIIMAWLDLFFTVVIMPQVVLFELRLVNTSYLTQTIISVTMYLLVQIAIVFDRIFAVFTPFKYVQNRDKCDKVLGGIYVVVIIYLETILLMENHSKIKLPHNLLRKSMVVIFVAVITIPLFAYPSIAFRLWRQKQKVVSNSGVNQEHAQVSKKRSAHVKTLRLCAGVLALFLISFVPNIFVGITDIRILAYFFFVNNIGNPVVYYVLNDQFRNKVNKLAARLSFIKAA